MNTPGWVFGVLCFCGIMAVTSAAQGVDRSPALEIGSVQSLAATVLNAHERQVETLVTTNTAVVLATGQHYLDAQGQWRETREEIEKVADGFVAAQGPTRGPFSNSHPTLWNQ